MTTGFSVVRIAAGAAASSSAVSANGRIVACGQTNAQRLHLTQVFSFHSGTMTATPRFSYADAPCSNVPSTWAENAETGRLSPFILPTGIMMSST